MRHHLVITLQIAILTTAPHLAGQESIPEVRVNLSARNRTINQVLDEITLQTGYYFTYNSALIPGNEKVQVRMQDLPLNQALDQLFTDPGFAYRMVGRNIVIYKKNQNPPSPLAAEIDRPVLKGQVLDSRTGHPLAYATIALYGTSLGSITNQKGEFSFKIPPDLADPMLVVSFMGYRRMLIPVIYPVDPFRTIRLERETIPLQEVIIRFTDPVSLLREAISRIPLNYLQDHSSMSAYYRESVKRNDHCMVFSEALLEVAKGPYVGGAQGDEVRILKGRKVTDLTTGDTVMIKLRSGIYSSLSLDVVKNQPDFLTENFQERYDLDFTDMMTYGDKLVYVISFTQKAHIDDLLFRGTIYIDQENLAILAADFEYNPELIQREPGLFLISSTPHIHIRPMFARYHVDYRDLNGQFHVSQVRAEVEMKVRRRHQWIGANYRIAIDMAITDVHPGERLRISPADRVRPGTVLADQPFEFDPLFWGPFNTIEPETTLLESIRRIESNPPQSP
jgi:hypothetical protein